MSFSTIAIAASAKAGIQSKEDANIIEFVEAPWGLGMTLFPVQKVILKAHYGLELDDTKKFKISDWRRENWKELTEKEYLKHIYDDGRCNIGEVIPGHERREMVLSIGRRSGKCVLGDTLVLTDNGIFRIDQLGDTKGSEFQPLKVTIAQEGKGVTSQSEFFYNGGVKPVFKFKTHCGYRLGGTGNHRIKVLSDKGDIEWKYLSDLKLGDTVCIHRDTNLWSNRVLDLKQYHLELGRKDILLPETLNEELALLLGLLVGDGSWTNTSSVALTVDDPETRDCCDFLLKKIFGETSFTLDKRTKRTGCLRYHSVKAREFLNRIGWGNNVTSFDKTTPFTILQSPREVVCAYLRGLFETDGGVEKNGMCVSFSTASERLAVETQVLLLNLGIVSRLKAKFNKKYNRFYYVIYIRGLESRKIFATEIGFISKRKMNPLIKGLEGIVKEGGDTESIPNMRGKIKDLLVEVPKNEMYKGWNRSILRQVMGNLIKPSSKENLTYSRLERILECANSLGVSEDKLSYLKHIQSLNYFFDPVTEITTDLQPVYDLNVPNGSMFVANGMTNHNTTISACIAAYETYKLIKKTDPQAYYGLPASNNIQIISVATDKDQAGLLYNEVSGHFRNCFAYDTEIITDQGVKKIGDVAGTEQILLTRDGSWVKAPIRSFGKQKLYKLTLMRQGVDKVIYTTENHRWYVLENKDTVITINLKPKDILEANNDIEWTVKDVEETDRFEEVYCATVEGHGNFTLEGNIVTGNCAFFGPYTANNTQSYARFQTPKDVERYGRYIEDPTAKATLKVTFRSCVAKGLRGAGNICVIMDEIAHFTETGQSGAEEVYNAVVPSTSAYSPKDPNDRRIPVGPVEGRVISISSPLGKQGLFYKLFQIGMQGGKASSNMLCVQAPTWEVNPTVPATEFEKHYLKNPTVFFTEYGGEFTDRTRGWIEDSKDLLKCVNPKRSAVERGQAKRPHFMGIDLALVGDGTAVAIGHVEEDKIILDKIDMIKAGEGKFANKERLDFDDVADWVAEYTKKFYITEGIFDQWAGIPFEQALQKRGLSQMKTINMTKQLTSQMFQNFKDMMWDERLDLYDKPNAENTNQHEAYLNELMELQSTVHSKNLITVEAPQVEGKHDDMSDALVRMVWIASQNVGKQKMIYTAGGGSGMYSPKRGGEIYFGRSPMGGNSTGRVAPKLPSVRGGSLRDRIIGRR